MNNEYKYKIGACKVCKQDCLEIVKEQETDKLFIYCDECEVEWKTPEEAIQNKNGSRFKYGKVIEPTYDEINAINWEKYLLT